MRDTPAHVGFDLALGEKRNRGFSHGWGSCLWDSAQENGNSPWAAARGHRFESRLSLLLAGRACETA